MTLLKYIRVFFLALYWKLPQGKELDWNPQESAIERSLTKEKRKRRKKKRKLRQLPPREKTIAYQGNYSSSRPKNLRFSDQRRLRRMYRNS